MKRKMLNDLDEYRTAMMTALHANSNIDDESRKKTLESIDESIKEMRHKILNAIEEDDVEEVVEETESFKNEKWW